MGTLQVCGEQIEYDSEKEYGFWLEGSYVPVDFDGFQRMLSERGGEEGKKNVSGLLEGLLGQMDVEDFSVKVRTQSLMGHLYASSLEEADKRGKMVNVLDKNVNNTIGLMRAIIATLKK